MHELKNGPIDYVEADLPLFRDVLTVKRCFAYAWTFNPPDWAVRELQRQLNQQGYIWFYLIGKKAWVSPLRLRIRQLFHSPSPLPCPPELWVYVPTFPPDEDYRDGFYKKWNGTDKQKAIHIWFRIDLIDRIVPPRNLRHLPPFFPEGYIPRFAEYKQNCFAFLNDK
ncbi:hypothetical protein ACFLXE_02900 [Chloroflexota bacterium]